METKHTPLPWDWGYQGGKYGNGELLILGPSENDSAELIGQIHTFDAEAAEANAAFIVRACNAHDELVRALETLQLQIESFYTATCTNALGRVNNKERKAAALATIVAALAKARGEA